MSLVQTLPTKYLGIVNDAAVSAIREQAQYLIIVGRQCLDYIEVSNWSSASISCRAARRIPVQTMPAINAVEKSELDWIEFEAFTKEWKKTARRISATAGDVLQNMSYLRLIGMGPKAIPLILSQLRKEIETGEPDHWFPALWVLTGEDPVPTESKGKIFEMARSWILWGEQRGLLDAKGMGSRVSAPW